MTPPEKFIHKSVVMETHYPDKSAEFVVGKALWVVAHRGYSGGRRLDLWAYSDESTALKVAAQLALDCGLDADQQADRSFKLRRYREVIDRYNETSPEWHILAVQEAVLMDGTDGGYYDTEEWRIRTGTIDDAESPAGGT